MTDKVILVTGGAGFIGSHQVAQLLVDGYRVRVLDNLATGSEENLQGMDVELIVGDIGDTELCERAVRGCDAVIHLAAMSKVGPSMDVPELCVRSNVIGTMNVALAALRNEVRAFVYAASSTYYGMNPAPNHPEQPPDCLNPYAVSKYQGELLVENFARVYGLPAMSLRYFNVYGPRQPDDGPYALVLGIFLRRRLQSLPLIIHGDGLQRRDFVHVNDVVRANDLAMRALWSESHTYRVLNVGSGRNISIIELAQLISDQHVHENRRAGDAQVTLADITQTTDVLGWRPEVDFADGVNELLETLESNAA